METKTRKSGVAALPALTGDAKKQFTALQKAGDAFVKSLTNTGDIPYRHLRILRRDVNMRYVDALQGRKADALAEKREAIKTRIAEYEAMLVKLDD